MGNYICAMLQSATGGELSCNTIVYALCAVIAAMAAFIVKQFADRISDLKETRDLSDTLLNQVSKDRGTR